MAAGRDACSDGDVTGGAEGFGGLAVGGRLPFRACTERDLATAYRRSGAGADRTRAAALETFAGAREHHELAAFSAG
jgi:hypothetical protein